MPIDRGPKRSRCKKRQTVKRNAEGAAAGPGQALGSVAGEIGSLLSDATRAGAALKEEPLTDLTQTWMAVAMELAARTGPGIPPAEPPGVLAREGPAEMATPAETMMRGVFRHSMPVLLTALSRGGDGYGLAKTVITLFGRPPYDRAAGLGTGGILQLVQADPDLWAQVAPVEATFRKFLDEFTGYDEWAGRQAP